MCVADGFFFPSTYRSASPWIEGGGGSGRKDKRSRTDDSFIRPAVRFQILIITLNYSQTASASVSCHALWVCYIYPTAVVLIGTIERHSWAAIKRWHSTNLKSSSAHFMCLLCFVSCDFSFSVWLRYLLFHTQNAACSCHVRHSGGDVKVNFDCYGCDSWITKRSEETGGRTSLLKL